MPVEESVDSGSGLSESKLCWLGESVVVRSDSLGRLSCVLSGSSFSESQAEGLSSPCLAKG